MMNAMNKSERLTVEPKNVMKRQEMREFFYPSSIVVFGVADKRTNLARDIHRQVQEVFGPKVFNTVIARNVRLEESPAYRETIFSFAPASSGAEEYASLAKEVLQRVG